MNLIEPWLPALAVLGGFALFKFTFNFLVAKMLSFFARRLALPTINAILSNLRSPISFLLTVLAVFFAALASPLAEFARLPVCGHLVRTAVLISIFWSINNLLATSSKLFPKFLASLAFKFDATLISIISGFLRFFFGAITLAMIVSEWGYDINGFIAGLSLGGLAISLAAKDALANVFGSILIIADKPFVVGDWIQTNGIEGTVEKITLRNTSIRTLPQGLVHLPNSLLTNTPINNFSKRVKRRIEINLGLTYSASADQIEAYIKDIKDFIRDNDNIYSEEANVTLNAFNDTNMQLFIACFTKTNKYLEFLKIKEELNFALLRLAAAHHIDLTSPRTTIFFENGLKILSAETPASKE